MFRFCFAITKFYGPQSSSKHASAWCNLYRNEVASTANQQFEGADLERLFIDQRVQTLLKALTGLELQKIYKYRRSNHVSSRRHYALMTDNMHKEFVSRLTKRALPFLQFVPFKEPRSNRADTLSINPEISGHDTYNMVFMDISTDSTYKDRIIVVREPNGRLRTALPEEHYRMSRIYFHQRDKPVKEPPVFSLKNKDGNLVPGEWLERAMNHDEHEFLLDWACLLFEPDQPKFVEFSICIFNNAIKTHKLHLLHSTRHFGTLVFYMLINDHISDLLNFYALRKSLLGVANTIRLYRIIYPDWKTIISSEDSELKVIQNYLNAQEAKAMKVLLPLKSFIDRLKSFEKKEISNVG